MDVLRNGDRQTITMKLGTFAPDQQTASLEKAPGKAESASEKLGATLATLTPVARDQLGLDTETDGVVITSLNGKGIAAAAGLQVGDVILQVGSTAVKTPHDVETALGNTKGNAVLLQIERDGNRIFVGVKLA